MHRTRRNKRTRRFTKKQRGGSLPALRRGSIQWPPNEGCADSPRKIVFRAGEMLDRFGPPSGSYVSPMGEAAVRIASELGKTNRQPTAYSYTNRALPYAGVSNGGVNGNLLRKKMYNETYLQNLRRGSSDYHVYKVLADGEVKGNGCIAAPVFNTKGGAIQVKLDSSIESLLENKVLEEMPVTQIPGYFPENTMIVA